MNILLVNTNPVVSRLVSLCVRDAAVAFEEVAQVTEAEGSRYDIVFVDDAAYNEKVSAFSSWVASVRKMVFLSSRDAGEEIGGKFDAVIKKPFLPSQIEAVIEQVKAGLSDDAQEQENAENIRIVPEFGEEETLSAEDETAKEEEEFIFPLASSRRAEVWNEEHETEDEAKDESVSKVLDSQEIEQIKALLEEENRVLPEVDLENAEEIEARKVEVIRQKLEEEGLEIVNEKEIVEVLSPEPEKVKKKKKRSKKRAEKKEEVQSFEEALLTAVEHMKPKKIKKLLKGAEVTIKIRFKDEG